MRIRVKNTKNSLVTFNGLSRLLSLPRGKEIDVIVETNDDKEVVAPIDLLDKINSGELSVVDWCDCKKPDSTTQKRKRQPEPAVEPATEQPAPKPRSGAKKAAAAELVTEQPAEDGDAKNPLADLKIV